VTLSDAEIERWSRQIVLPEVGARGQERLCAARAAVCGTSAAAAVAAELLARAGVQITRDAAEVVLDLGAGPTPAPSAAIVVRGRMHGARLAVTTLVGRPCGACFADPNLPAPDGPPAPTVLAPAAACVLGALAAAQALGALLFRPRAGRTETVDLETGRFAGATVAPSAGCDRCRDCA
jgi:hypothetical protein